ncbi:MAG: response regulator, partial [Chloroflexota bacterium]
MSEKRPKKLRKISSSRLKRLSPRPDRNDKIRVLYVEDASVIRDTIAALLEIKGYDVNTFLPIFCVFD